jgi:hypothetical protein
MLRKEEEERLYLPVEFKSCQIYRVPFHFLSTAEIILSKLTINDSSHLINTGTVTI